MRRWTQQNQNPDPNPSPDPELQGEPRQGAEGAGEADAAAQEQIAQLTAERDEANAKYLHSLADFQNYQRRALLNEQEARRQGVTAVLMSILPVMDHFDLALTQAESGAAGTGSVDAVMDGVRAIRADLVKALGLHGISIIAPAPGEEFDPNRHQAIMHTPPGETGVAPGHVLATHQAGYALGDRVVRPAKVSVASEG